ncbi:MAG: hypothetical protein I8H86_10085 [Sphingomonadaceae bacterium]|nr:hypothetical protein [Sphingomonadaceae bacterium]
MSGEGQMKANDARRFRAACKKMSDQLGTPGFEGAVLSFYVALSAITKSETKQ